MATTREGDLRFLAVAMEEARAGHEAGGVPVGSVLVVDGAIAGRGRNRRHPDGNPILHGEMSALQDAGRLPAAAYRRSVLYTSLSPCAMCSGAIVLFGIPRVVLAENETFLGEEEWLRSRGVELVNYDLEEAKALMRRFQAERPELWNEDIAVDG